MIIMFLGALFFLAGLIFTLQGYGIVGPNSSFMFRNPTWIYDGMMILIVGLLLIGTGLAFRPRANTKAQTNLQPANPSN